MARGENADGGGDGHRRRAHFGGRVRTRTGKKGHVSFIPCFSSRLRGCHCAAEEKPVTVKFILFKKHHIVFVSLLFVIYSTTTTICRLFALSLTKPVAAVVNVRMSRFFFFLLQSPSCCVSVQGHGVGPWL